jgi:hypothetical protein
LIKKDLLLKIYTRLVGKNSNIEVEDVEDVEDAGHIRPLRGKKGLTLMRMTKDEKGLAFFKGLLL